MRLHTLFGMLAVCLAGAASAQQTAQDRLSGKAAVGYLATSGNTESTNANASLSLQYDLERWSHEIDLHAVSATSAEVTTAEAYSATYEAKQNIGEKSYWFTSLDWERDHFSAYERRTAEAAGYGRRLIGTDAHKFDAEIGAGARQAVPVEGPKEKEGIVRGSLSYEYTVNDTTQFTQDLLVTSGRSNTNLESVSELRARLFGAVALVLSYRVKHNSSVPAGKARTDRFSSISLEYSF
jgi:putative salt-induced outer membrane protein